MRLVKSDNPVLRQVAKEVDVSNSHQLQEYQKILEHYFYVEKGQRILGCSLPQFGVSSRMCLCKLPSVGITIMVNPKIRFKLGFKLSIEGCESLGGKSNRYVVSRPIVGFVTWFTEHGEKKKKWFTYKSMRIIQHEVDHLNGILIDKGMRL